MLQYTLRRLLLTIPTFIGITLLVFTITRFVPGGPIERAIANARSGQGGGEGGGGAGRTGSMQAPLSEEQLKQLNEYYGFDKPVLVSYMNWLGKVLRFDLGSSTRYGEPVWDSIKQRLPVSAFYGLFSMIFTYLICIPLGILKALKHQTIFDNISSILVFVGYAIPGYVVGIALLVLFGSRWQLLPMGGFASENFADLSSAERIWDIAKHSVMPMTAYMVGSFAMMTFLLKNSLMDQLGADYIRTAIAKGLPFRKAVVKHAIRNSLIPIATHFGNNISFILAGSFLIEKIFNIDGLGLLGYESVVERDYPIVMGVLVISAGLQLIGNILSDLCVALVDPRVQY